MDQLINLANDYGKTYIGFARQRLREIEDLRKRVGLPFLSKNYVLGDIKILVQSWDLMNRIIIFGGPELPLGIVFNRGTNEIPDLRAWRVKEGRLIETNVSWLDQSPTLFGNIGWWNQEGLTLSWIGFNHPSLASSRYILDYVDLVDAGRTAGFVEMEEWVSGKFTLVRWLKNSGSNWIVANETPTNWSTLPYNDGYSWYKVYCGTKALNFSFEVPFDVEEIESYWPVPLNEILADSYLPSDFVRETYSITDRPDRLPWVSGAAYHAESGTLLICLTWFGYVRRPGEEYEGSLDAMIACEEVRAFDWDGKSTTRPVQHGDRLATIKIPSAAYQTNPEDNDPFSDIVPVMAPIYTPWRFSADGSTAVATRPRLVDGIVEYVTVKIEFDGSSITVSDYEQFQYESATDTTYDLTQRFIEPDETYTVDYDESYTAEESDKVVEGVNIHTATETITYAATVCGTAYNAVYVYTVVTREDEPDPITTTTGSKLIVAPIDLRNGVAVVLRQNFNPPSNEFYWHIGNKIAELPYAGGFSGMTQTLPNLTVSHTGYDILRKIGDNPIEIVPNLPFPPVGVI